MFIVCDAQVQVENLGLGILPFGRRGNAPSGGKPEDCQSKNSYGNEFFY
jgi:hypothetical protein